MKSSFFDFPSATKSLTHLLRELSQHSNTNCELRRKKFASSGVSSTVLSLKSAAHQFVFCSQDSSYRSSTTPSIQKYYFSNKLFVNYLTSPNTKNQTRYSNQARKAVPKFWNFGCRREEGLNVHKKIVITHCLSSHASYLRPAINQTSYLLLWKKDTSTV